MWLWILSICLTMIYGDMALVDEHQLSNGIDYIRIEENAVFKKINLYRIDVDTNGDGVVDIKDDRQYDATFYERK